MKSNIVLIFALLIASISAVNIRRPINLLQSKTKQSEWVGGTTYATGDSVTRSGSVYKCLVGGWCSLAAYDPVGTFGQYAWEKTGAATTSSTSTSTSTTSTSSGSVKTYVAGESYSGGEVVLDGGKYYECLSAVAAWCSMAAYAPSGAYGSAAWTDVSSQYGGSVTVVPVEEEPVQTTTTTTTTEPVQQETTTTTTTTEPVQQETQQQETTTTPTVTTDSTTSSGSTTGAYTLESLPGTEALPSIDGPWTGHDWESTEFGFKIDNGRIIGTTEKMKRMLKATARCGVPEVDLANPERNGDNVQRIMRVLSKEDWDYLTPVRNAVYTYEELLKAAAKFPAFCGEKPADNPEDMDNLCKRELATCFAHFTQETGAHWPGFEGIQEEWRQGLYFLAEAGCSNTGGGCDYRQCDGWVQEAFPCQAGQKYFGRGAKQLSYNYNYGPFSKVMFSDEMVLLNDPDRVAREGWLAVASAFWFYMTPQSPKPSIHDVVTRFWKPNSADAAAGIEPGFGSTINIINGGLECGFVKPQAENRVKYYKAICNYLKVQIPSDEVYTCVKSQQFPDAGAGAIFSYWDKDWADSKKCKPAKWQTAYSFWILDGYKKCVKKHSGA